eukprot:3659675-Pleurochrysis_carterae.AAC.1
MPNWRKLVMLRNYITNPRGGPVRFVLLASAFCQNADASKRKRVGPSLWVVMCTTYYALVLLVLVSVKTNSSYTSLSRHTYFIPPHHLIYRYFSSSRSKAARGPSRSFRPTQFNHARLSWRALPILIIYGDRYQSYRPPGAGSDDSI